VTVVTLLVGSIRRSKHCLTKTGALVMLHYWAVAENYIVIIVASAPPLNLLVKRARQHIGNCSDCHKMPSNEGITVKSSWAIQSDPMEGSKPINTLGLPREGYAESRRVVVSRGS
jgi:hypothetical protein